MPSLNGKRVLVTGGAGFIGSHLVDRLIAEKPERIVAVDNLFLGRRENLADAFRRFDGLSFYREDVCRYAAMKKILADNDIDVIFDLAVIPLPASLVKPEWSFKKNVDMTLNLCRLGREKAYETLVHFSSSEVYGTAEYAPMDERHHLGAITPYAASKAAGDQLVLSYARVFGLDAAILRPFNNYGPRQNEGSYAGVIPLTLKRMAAGKPPIIYGTGRQTRDYLYVTETADAAVQVYKNPRTRGRILNIGSGRETSINTVIRLLAKNAGYRGKILRQPARPGDVMRHIADVSAARKLIRFSQRIPFEEGIRRTVTWSLAKRAPRPRT